MPKLCEYNNCRERASYGVKRNIPIRCKKHKENMRLASMICVCGKSQPNFNNEWETKALYCSVCKSDEMVDVKHKKCVCGKSRPYFNNKCETKALYCFECKTDKMVDVMHKKCFCGKSYPIYNNEWETKPLYCFECKTDEMVDVISKKCFCGKSYPTYNNAGEIKALYCSKCKKDEMVDVKHKKCLGFINNGITEACPYDTTGNPKYKNYCTECFKRNFPLDPLTFQIQSKTKEIAVRDFINENFNGFQHNKPLKTGHCDCTMRRSIDHRKLIGNTLLAIETDENQHKPYNKMDEEMRYDDLYMAHSGKWIYIRFNPDKYIDNKGIRKNPMLYTRLEKLKNEIEKQIKRIENEENKELVERVYMYYDGYN
jgi:hypothetical protein